MIDYNTDLKYTVPKNTSITEIWISFKIQYTKSSANSNNRIERDLYIGVGSNNEIGVRHYADSYYYNSTTYVCWDISYDPSTRIVQVLPSWLLGYENGTKFTPNVILYVWYR